MTLTYYEGTGTCDAASAGVSMEMVNGGCMEFLKPGNMMKLSCTIPVDNGAAASLPHYALFWSANVAVLLGIAALSIS